MKTIKFRIWSSIYKEFRYWGFIQDGIFAGIPSNSEMTIDFCRVNSQQFTGLHDKNGKEVFESDILKAPNGNLFEVIWENDLAGFRLRNKWDEDVVQQNRFPVRVGLEKMQDLEIIGNLFENPELIK